ncbi:MAG: hemolysin III family protein [Firmicutes bacterium]|nr:hemolysin III family protein [Bacillota bacterium]
MTEAEITLTPTVKNRIALPSYTLGEELVNAISHGIGALLSVAALILCILKSISHHNAYAVVASAIYGGSLLILYLTSCIYHSLRPNRAKRVFRVLDHCTIFLLIFGSYLPFTLVTLRGTTGWILFGVNLAAVITGITLNAVNIRKFTVFSMICYLVMGWSILFALQPLLAIYDLHGFLFLLGGGLAYTFGCVLYGLGRHIRYMHSIWHLFVLAGSILHFFAIYGYVL